MSESGLSNFQIEIANLFFSLPESAGFLLAGGGALIAQGIVQRPTEDLDFFTSRQLGSVDAASDALVAVAAGRGWTCNLRLIGEDFRRWEITGGDCARRSRRRQPQQRPTHDDRCGTSPGR